MHAPVKLLLWLLAGTGTLFAVLVSMLFFIDVNLYRDTIEQHVSAAFGREVVLAGPMRLDPSLTPRFVVNGLRISNPDWASRPFLATADKFDIRVSLLPLLRGNLQIVSLEFHGVDLLLEKTTDGINNFTFDTSDDPANLPAIDHMSLHDVAVAYSAADGQVKRLEIAHITASKVPGQAVELAVNTTVNTVPVTLSLSAKPLDKRLLQAPWHLTLLGEAGGTTLQLEGSIADLTDWNQGEYRLDLEGRRMDELGSLSGYMLPEPGPFKLSANINYSLGEHVSVTDLDGSIGSSDLRGNLHWDFGAPRSAIKARLHSQRLNTGELGTGGTLTDNATPDNIPLPGDIDLDIEIQVQQLNGQDNPAQDILLTARADHQQLELAVVTAKVNETHITASAILPWGDNLTAPELESTRLKTLLQDARFYIRAQPPDTAYGYSTNLMGHPLDLMLSTVEATARPDAPLTIRAEFTLNNEPVTANLKGETLASLLERPDGPWQTLTLEIVGEDLQLEANGSISSPFELEGIDVSYVLRGTDAGTLLPLQGAWSLTGQYTDKPDHNVFDKLRFKVGNTDIGGHIAVYPGEKRNRLLVDLNARRIDLADLPTDRTGGTPVTSGLDEPFGIGTFSNHDLDVRLRIQHLQGLDNPVQDIRVGALGNAQVLILEPLEGVLDGIPVRGRIQLPWGERLEVHNDSGISIVNLVQLADLTLSAQPPEGKLKHRTNLMGHPFELELTSLDASARPGKALQIKAKALLDNTPIEARLQAKPLVTFLRQPAGPWEDLELEVQVDDIRLEATGSVTRPFKAEGLDIRYAVRGAEINTLLPIFNLILPLEGAYSLTGHFADKRNRLIFDDLKIESGSNDISGDLTVFQLNPRPKVVANLTSEQIYLSSLLPVSENDTANETETLVIPDYDLPIERMQEFDGELTFRGKRLRTTAGDLGNISFKATLQDGIFRMDPFEVRGWAGAFIESDGTIDASQEPPLVNWNWIARELNYGVLLEQAGFAETVEGLIDVTLRLSGKGRTRREFLSNADGELLIVGKEGVFGSRRLDLWGSPLVSTMLSRDWRSDDVTALNCMVARINIEDGMASSDEFIVDTRRVTIAATGVVDLSNEVLDLVIAPRPKRSTLVSLANPVHVTGTIASPKVAVTTLPRNRTTAAGTGMLAGLINPGYLIFTFSQRGSGQANACEVAIAETMAMKKGQQAENEDASTKAPRRFSLLPGCTPTRQRAEQ